MGRYDEHGIVSKWFLRKLILLVVATVIFAGYLGMAMTRAGASAGVTGGYGDTPDWTSPGAMSVRRTGPPSTRPGTPWLFGGIDCTPVTYRLVGGHGMKEGCFTETALGSMDIDSSVIIFNGTDEGLPLKPYTPHQILVPWPRAGDMLALNPVSTGGTLMGLYKDPAAAMQDRRGASGNLADKELVMPPDLTLQDAGGRPLIINPQTLAFSQGGAWLVAETLEGSFVRVDLNTLSAKPFAHAYGTTGSPALLKSQVAVSEDGLRIAIANDYAGVFRVYDLAGCGPAPTDSALGLPPQNCKSYDYRPFIRSKIPGLRLIKRLRFVNDGLLSFEAVSSDSARDGTYELAPAAAITSLTDYIGLGDSYTSGEGAFDYLPGTDTPDNTCHLSVNSYPLLLARDLFGASGGHSAACSGAVINDIVNTGGRYSGQARNGTSLDELRRNMPQVLESIETGFLPGYIAQHRFVRRWQPRVATVSIAGNDIGFGDILQNCVEPHISWHRSGNTCYATYEDRLEIKNLVDRTVPRWKALFSQLEREAPSTRFYVLGYPQIALSGGDCGTNVRLDRKELEFAAETVDYIDHDIKEAAAGSGVIYVDISRALYGHRLCEAKGYAVAMNGLTAGNDFGLGGIGLLGRESFHPNALGQELIEQSILRQTHDLTGSVSDTDVSEQESGGHETSGTAAAALLDAPRSGRTVYVLTPDDGMAGAAVKRGTGLHIRISAAKDGLRRDAVYTARLDGPEGPVLGTIISDGSGNVDGYVPIPGDTPVGSHRIDLTGKNQDDAPVDITRPVYVLASGALGPLSSPSATASGGSEVPRVSGRPYNVRTMYGQPRGENVVLGTIRAASGRHAAGNGPVRALTAGAIILGILLFTAGKINKKGRSGLQ